METITAERIVELFEKNRAALKRFAALVMSEDEVRLALVSAVLRDVATRDYVDRRFAELRDYVDKRFAELRGYVDSRFSEMREYVDRRFSDVQGYVDRRFAEVMDRISLLDARVSRVEGQLA
ncbi:MAG: hypothetical protein ACTSXX_05240, partial [Candidatus Baldrarchaeia archaeon]